ncbi:hypothetical protein CCACVL1_17290 [Corchorus capsularis]|uniref:Disease resistance N-terminal domain-containing protein n=1 Tax=Corchorus capsularis TaxID=210143 RepID=A0A1R3HSK7_COCAP|nr:hypothetical protein CCACVL1_17290 [Corchorus capsularis]
MQPVRVPVNFEVLSQRPGPGDLFLLQLLLKPNPTSPNLKPAPLATSFLHHLRSPKPSSTTTIEPQIEDLEEKLEEIRAVIDDAEEILFTDRSKSFKIELPKLKYLAYELEDVVDEFKTHIAIKFQV